MNSAFQQIIQKGMGISFDTDYRSIILVSMWIRTSIGVVGEHTIVGENRVNTGRIARRAL